VLRHAYAIGASAIRAGSDFFFERLDDARWRWRELDFAIELPMPALAAPVQLRNAAVAIAALRALDVDIPEEAFAQGVAAARLPGRLQRFERNGIEVLVDVGHNPQAARALVAWLHAAPRSGRTVAIYAALADKDVTGVVTTLAPAVDAWRLAGTQAAGPRGMDVDALALQLQPVAPENATKHADVGAALDAALLDGAAGDRILVFGSFHAAAIALQLLAAR